MTGASGARSGLTMVADDYGLAPGVNRAIRKLIASEKIDGTGCMTLFADWRVEAAGLKALCESRYVEAGLHLTLTDFNPMSGRNAFGERRRMPSVDALIKASLRGKVDAGAVEAELDAQFAAFVEAMGGLPAYIDGHQHVHFLPVVRGWLARRAALLSEYGKLPWLRGAPSVMSAPGLRIKAKTAVVAVMAMGFGAAMRKCGYSVRGPLLGFYDWSRPEEFEPMLRSLIERGSYGIMMCHPGFVDKVLKQRDGLIEARDVEYSVLSNLDPRLMRIESTFRREAS
jgi:chitin disaccharide deacetylase